LPVDCTDAAASACVMTHDHQSLKKRFRLVLVTATCVLKSVIVIISNAFVIFQNRLMLRMRDVSHFAQYTF